VGNRTLQMRIVPIWELTSALEAKLRVNVSSVLSTVGPSKVRMVNWWTFLILTPVGPPTSCSGIRFVEEDS